MTYRTARRTIDGLFTALGALLLSALCLLVSRESFTLLAIIIAILFVTVFSLKRNIVKWAVAKAHKRKFEEGDTGVLTAFLDSLRVCFTPTQFIDAIKEKLERDGDISILIIDLQTNDTVYASGSAVTSNPETLSWIALHYTKFDDGIFFFDRDLSLVTKPRKARGFFIQSRGKQFWFFVRYCKLLESQIFAQVRTELETYYDRQKTVNEMFTISALSREWDLIAETQMSFLPKDLPDLKKLDVASYYRPLVNVSGDYYDIISVDENRTLLVLGDVSGKGLAAALIMGIIMSTVRTTEDKTNLAQLVKNIDKSIKGMRFEDKYTVLFIGLVDIDQKKMTYVNASMADPLVVSQTATGWRVRTIESNNSLVGLIPIDEVQVDEIPIRTGDVIIIATDGVSEVSNAEGVQLGDTELYQDTIVKAATSGAQEIVDTVSNLVLRYVGDRKLRDDVTMLVAKVGKLWD